MQALALRLKRPNGQVDWDVVRLLGEMGPAAAEALPALRELEEDLRKLYPEDFEEPSNPPSQAEHPLAWAIWRSISVSGQRTPG